jgi:hypothetical protein
MDHAFAPVRSSNSALHVSCPVSPGPESYGTAKPPCRCVHECLHRSARSNRLTFRDLDADNDQIAIDRCRRVERVGGARPTVGTPVRRFSRPFSPKSRHGCPVLASSATKKPLEYRRRAAAGRLSRLLLHSAALCTSLRVVLRNKLACVTCERGVPAAAWLRSHDGSASGASTACRPDRELSRTPSSVLRHKRNGRLPCYEESRPDFQIQLSKLRQRIGTVAQIQKFSLMPS